MKKFLEFIWVLISPVVIFIFQAIVTILALIWAFTLFGVMIIFGGNELPSPLWLKWVIGIFDVLILVIIVYGAIKDAYEKVYKN